MSAKPKTSTRTSKTFDTEQAGSRSVKSRRAPYADKKSRLPDDFDARDAREAYHSEAIFGQAPRFKRRTY